ncbi:PIN domain-containing protein [Candidatus Amesbacteria bacterium]|nr:PIN domain-containing protein [Candidatus Amesbacteria bacterium]MBI2587543.1 PIN domain-containing protein [Candidatus Amesbacteria bacterium]
MAINLSGQLLAIDSMVFIYYLDPKEERLHTASQQVIELLLKKRSQGVTSIVSVLETLSPSYYLTDQDRLENYSLFFHSIPNLKIIEVDWDVALEAARLRRENKSLRTPDSIQLATALIHKADVFITNDDRLKNLSFPNLKILPIFARGPLAKGDVTAKE